MFFRRTSNRVMIVPRETVTMKSNRNQEQASPFERLQDQVIRSRGQSLEVLLDSLTSDASVTFEQVLFDRKSMSIRLRWPFWLARPLGDPGDYLRTVNAQIEFRKGLRRHLKGHDAGRHLASALYRELKAFTILFTKAHRWGERVVDGLNSVGERRMAGRRSRVEIDKHESNQILRKARIIAPTIIKISDRAKSLKSRGPALRRKILRDYDRDQYPWIRSLFPSLRDLHGRPTLDKLDRRTTRKLVAAIVQREIYIETGTKHFLGAIEQLLRHQ
jgi:hypothetical protein